MIKHKDSHVDHGLTALQLEYIVGLDISTDGHVTVKTIELPEEYGQVPCALYGPVMGDEPITEDEVTYEVRGDRPGPSRMVERPTRMTRKVTVIAGPHDGYADVLYTAFGGPSAPKEMYEWANKENPEFTSLDEIQSREFWKEHALAKEDGDDHR